MKEQMTEAFEEWYQKTYICFGQANFHLNSYGEYVDDDIEASWCAWQAALAAVPAQEPVGEVQHYAAPANLPAYVNMKWYGKPPKNGTKLYTAPVKQDELKAKLVANMIRYLGATKTQAKAIVDGVFDGEHTINQADLEPVKQESKPMPFNEIGGILNEVMDNAVRNVANSISMPDEYVAVAHFLCYPEEYCFPVEVKE